MILVDKFNQRKEINKLLREGSKVHSLNTPVDLMNSDELYKEVTYLVYKNRNSDVLDARTIELLKEMFSYGENTDLRT